MDADTVQNRSFRRSYSSVEITSLPSPPIVVVFATSIDPTATGRDTFHRGSFASLRRLQIVLPSPILVVAVWLLLYPPPDVSALAIWAAADGGNFAALALFPRAASPAANDIAIVPYTSSPSRPSHCVAPVQIAYAASIASTS